MPRLPRYEEARHIHDELKIGLWLVAILLANFFLWVLGVRFIYQEWPL